MSKQVLITGGAGFIGSNLALHLLAKGYKVKILDSLSPQIHGADPDTTSFLYNTIKDKCEFIKGSVMDKALLEKAVEGSDYIIHLAAETGTGQSMYEVAKYVEVNSLGTAYLLDILVNKKHGVKKLVIASSRSVYGEGAYKSADGRFVYPLSRKADDMEKKDFDVKDPSDHAAKLELCGTHEESRINTESLYAVTKYNQEQMALTVCRSIGLPCVAFRYQNVYGPGQSLLNPYTGILAIFSGLIHNGKTIRIFEDGMESRDFVYIDDVVNATVLGMEAGHVTDDYFNVGSGTPVSVMTVAKTLLECYGKECPIEITGEFRLGDIRHNYADLTKISKALNFKPTVDFKEGISRFAAWVGKQDAKSSSSDSYERSLQELKSKGLMK